MRILLFLVPLAGCGAGGAMRQATIVGQCAADDAACSRRHPMAPLAIGTRFHPDISTEIAGTTTPTLILDSADPHVLAIEDGALLAKHPGASAVMISTDNGSVIDFIHVWVAPITKITFARRDGDRIESAIGLTVGEDVTLVPTLWNGAQRLAGSSDATWTVDAEGALAVLRDGSADRRRLRARAPGKATVTVALGDAKASFDVEVVP
ncbi:MAG: hypothetical protein H0T42_34520 [Deltaproteobacteria bacterium]|nr:hypothetical protein [Deltaproteobacteria bacterium]